MNNKVDERICKICGATFIPRVPSQLCCCKECSKENNRRLNNKHQNRYRKEQAEKPKDIPYKEKKEAENGKEA